MRVSSALTVFFSEGKNSSVICAKTGISSYEPRATVCVYMANRVLRSVYIWLFVVCVYHARSRLQRPRLTKSLLRLY